jgi:hypothetical protein
MYDRAQRTPRVDAWQKACPLCEHQVTHASALAHLAQEHGAMFRVESWMRERGMPEATFDEITEFIHKLARS